MTRYEISGAMVTSIHGEPIQVVDLGEGDGKNIPGRMWFIVTTPEGAEISINCRPDDTPEVGAQVTIAVEVED